MPKRLQNKEIHCTYFRWILSKNPKGIWKADGRSNSIKIGRQSLGTDDYEEARQQLIKLDLKMAVKFGKASPSLLVSTQSSGLSLAEGRRLYESHITRPREFGGARNSTQIRYRAVFKKFFTHLESLHITTWNEVTEEVLRNYIKKLENEDFAPRTRCLEATTIKQTIKLLVSTKHLPPSSQIALPVAKAQGTSTYCLTKSQVDAILAHCSSKPGIHWLGNLLTTLAYTGMRISEGIALRWVDVRLSERLIVLKDETSNTTSKRKKRTLKSGRDRTIPIQDTLMPILEQLSQNGSATGLVFSGPNGRPLLADTIRTLFKREVLQPLADQFPTTEEESGFIDARLHSFRHFFCSFCASRGVNRLALQKWLGHRDSKMVEYYFTLHDSDSHNEMSKLKDM